MYKIFIGESLIMETAYPSYVYWDDRIKSFRTCEESLAEAVYIVQKNEEGFGSYFADIESKEARHEGFPVARIIIRE